MQSREYLVWGEAEDEEDASGFAAYDEEMAAELWAADNGFGYELEMVVFVKDVLTEEVTEMDVTYRARTAR